MKLSTIRDQFPIYQHHPDLVYLDSTATSLKPKCVIEAMDDYYYRYGVNIHRGVYRLSYQATESYDHARDVVAKFINSESEEVIFLRNASEALNFVALTYGKKLKKGDVVLTSELEHHSSLLPWMKMCEETGATLRYIPLNEEGRITIDNFKKVFDENVRVCAITYVSNVMGYITPIKEIIALAHPQAVVIVDAAQAVPHIHIDVKDLDCDFLAFSGHKMLGPTGIGVLFGKKEILKTLQPLYYGGDMNDNVELYDVTIKEIPYCFEAGTPAISEAIGLAKAIEFIEEIGIDNIAKHTDELHKYALEKLKQIEHIKIYNPNADVAIITFNLDGVHPHDAATVFDERGVCLRAGHHCAQLVSNWLACVGTLRASFYLYNTYQDVDIFVEALHDAVQLFERLNG